MINKIKGIFNNFYIFLTVLFESVYLRNRRYFWCSYQVMRNTNRSQGEQEMTSCRTVNIAVLPNFHECFHNLIETEQKMFSISVRKHCEKKNTLIYFNIIIIIFIRLVKPIIYHFYLLTQQNRK